MPKHTSILTAVVACSLLVGCGPAAPASSGTELPIVSDQHQLTLRVPVTVNSTSPGPGGLIRGPAELTIGSAAEGPTAPEGPTAARGTTPASVKASGDPAEARSAEWSCAINGAGKGGFVQPTPTQTATDLCQAYQECCALSCSSNGYSSIADEPLSVYPQGEPAELPPLENGQYYCACSCSDDTMVYAP